MTRGGETQARKPGEKLGAAFKDLFHKKHKGGAAAQEAPRAEKAVDTQQLLAHAQAVLQKLRAIDARNPEAFPLLNDCTRCGGSPDIAPCRAPRGRGPERPSPARRCPQSSSWRAPSASCRATSRRSGASEWRGSRALRRCR
jgi:hypothetical protein